MRKLRRWSDDRGAALLLAELGDALSRAATASAVAAEFTERALPALGARAGALYLLDHQRRALVLNEATALVPPELSRPWHVLALDGGISPNEDVVASGEASHLNRPEFRSRYPDIERVADLMDASAIATLPLVDQDHVLGTASYVYERPQRFDPAQRALLAAVTDRFAHALARAALFEEERVTRRRLEALQALAERLAGANTFTDAARAFIDVVMSGTGAAAAIVGVASADARRMEDLALAGFPEHVAAALPELLITAPNLARDAVLAGRTMVVDTVAERDGAYPDFAHLHSEPDGALVVMPLRVNGRATAAIGIHLGRDGPLPPAELAFLETLGEQFTVALERAWLERRQQQRQLRTETLQRLSALLNAASDADRIVNAVVESSVGLDESVLTALALLASDASEARITVGERVDEAVRQRWQRVPLALDIPVTAAMRTGEEVICHSLDEVRARYPSAATDMAAAGIAALVALAVRTSDGRVIGAIGFHWATAISADAEMLDALRVVAQITGQALERSLLYEAERRAAERANTLLRFTHALGAVTTVTEIAEAIVMTAIDALKAGAATVSLLTGDRQMLRIAATSGYDDQLVEPWLTYPVELASPATEAIRSGEPIFLESLDHVAREYPAMADTGDLASVSLPLGRDRDNPIGVLYVGFTASRSFSVDERELMVAMAVQGSEALERALTFEQHALARSRAEALSDLVGLLEAEPTVTGRAQRLVEFLVPLIADYATIRRTEPPYELVAAHHRDPAGLALLKTLTLYRHEAYRRLLARVASGRPVLVDEHEQHRFLASFASDPAAVGRSEQLNTRAQMWVRLAVGGERPFPLVLHVALTDPARARYSQSDLDFVAGIAARAAVAFEAARASEIDREHAVRLQRELLPNGPVGHRTVELAVRYRPGDERLHVGGDWYETIALADGRLMVAVGDIVGHGIEAAAVMGQVRTAFATLAPREPSPVALLDALDVVARGVAGAEFSTLCCALIDPDRGTVTYAGAGHPPMLIVHPELGTSFLDEHLGWPLCALASRARRQAVAPIAPGSTLLAYSDGLVERYGEPINVGLARLERAAARTAALGVENACDTIMAELAADQPLDDDVVLVAARIHRPRERVLSLRRPALPAELAPMRAELRQWLTRSPLDPSHHDAVVLAVGEATANAVEHAYRDGPPGDVEVAVHYEGHEIIILVRDWGRWRSPSGEPGRGWGTALMRHPQMGFSRQSDATGTTVTLVVRPREGSR